VAGSCEYGDEPSGSGATELVSYTISAKKLKPSHYVPRNAWGRGGSSYSFLTSALGGVNGQRHAPAVHYPGKGPPVPIVQEAGWAPEPVWTQRLEENPIASAGDRTSIVLLSSP
jgi:hypothetical protein